MPTKNIQTETKDFCISQNIADKFILFLKRTALEEGGLFESKNILSETMPAVKNIDSDIKYEVIEDFAYRRQESRLAKVLDIKKNYKEIQDDFDIEEKLTDDWLSDAKRFHSSMPIKRELPKTKSGFKINFKNSENILMPPSFNNFLPANPDRKKITISRSLIAPAPLALKLVTLVIAALVLSAFTYLSSAKLSDKIVSFSDDIFRYPINQLNLFAVNIYPELMYDNNNFYYQSDKIIAGNKKIKSDYILENRNYIENNKNKTSFLITREELLGLPVSASENIDGQLNKKNWQEKTDIMLQKISSSVEKFLDYIVEKQERTSLKTK